MATQGTYDEKKYMLENTEEVIKKDNPEKLATQDTYDERKKNNKSTTQNVVDIIMRKQTQIT